MLGMDAWDGAIYLVAGYVAVVALVRGMTAYRMKLLDEVREQAEAEARRKQAAEQDAADDGERAAA